MEFTLTQTNAKAPESDGLAVMLFAALQHKLTIVNAGVQSIETGTSFEIPDGHVGLLLPCPAPANDSKARMGPADGQNVLPPGPVDGLKVQIHNRGFGGVHIFPGDPVARLLLVPVTPLTVDVVGEKEAKPKAEPATPKKRRGRPPKTTPPASFLATLGE